MSYHVKYSAMKDVANRLVENTICIVMVIFFAISFLNAGELENVKWEKVITENEIDVFRQTDSDTRVLAMRGKTVIDASIEKVISILLEPDLKRRKDWFENLLDYKLIQQESPLIRILHITVDVPWPFQDRDFVYSAELSVKPDKKKVILIYKTVENVVKEQKLRVRGDMESIFILTSIGNGEKTIIDVQTIVDPKGIIPKNIVNIVQKKFAYDMLINLRNLSYKPEIMVLAEFKDILNLGMGD